VPEPAAAVHLPDFEVVGEAKWALAWPLWTDRTFETLQVGAHNRFAHAAAMSVCANVGTMYNPLTLFGGSSTGKSHFLNALGTKLPQDGTVLRTTGVRMSFMAISQGQAFANQFQPYRVLLVDDLELMMLTETNKPTLAKVLANFLSGGKQLVLACGQNPKALGYLEAALGFTFAQGWTVELKAPGPAALKMIGGEALVRSGLGLTEGEGADFAIKAGGTLHGFVQLLRRVKSLREAGLLEPLPALLSRLDLPGEPSPIAESVTSEFRWPAGSPSRGGLALLFPEGKEGAARHFLSKVHAAFGRLALQGSFQEVASRGYAPAKGIEAVLQVADGADRVSAAAALVLGPQADVNGGLSEPEFAQGVLRALASIKTRAAYVRHSTADSDQAAACAAGDLLAEPQ